MDVSLISVPTLALITISHIQCVYIIIERLQTSSKGYLRTVLPVFTLATIIGVSITHAASSRLLLWLCYNKVNNNKKVQTACI